MESESIDYTKALMVFLAESLDIPIEAMPHPNEWTGTGNTIGALALRAGILDVQQIDAIIEAQQSEDGRFGEIGRRLGYLAEDSLECLLELQRFHRCLDLGALLVLKGHVTLSDLLRLLATFFGGEPNGACAASKPPERTGSGG